MKTRSKNKKKATNNHKHLRLVLPLIILLGVAAILVLRTPQKVTSPSLAAEISVNQAVELRNAGAFILDVREPSEWNEAHIPDSTLIPLGQLPSRLAEVPKNQQIIVVCRSGNRSQTGRDILLQAGFENVTSLSGGLRAWQTASNPITKGP